MALLVAGLLPRPAAAMATQLHTQPLTATAEERCAGVASSSGRYDTAPRPYMYGSVTQARDGRHATPLAEVAAASAVHHPAPYDAYPAASNSVGASRTEHANHGHRAAPGPGSHAVGVQDTLAAASGGSGRGGSAANSTATFGTAASPASAAQTATEPAAAAEAVAAAEQQGLGQSEAAAVRLFDRGRASVVNISHMRAMQTFTTLDLSKLPCGQGSGFLWGERGHVVTAYHLVKGAAEVKVTLPDHATYTAKVLGHDAAKDLAVLKLSVPKSKLRELQPVTLGSAAGLRVGQTVYGIANPWGLGHTLSKGVVAGLGLEAGGGLFPVKGLIGVAAPPQPGSGGGVLLDGTGALVGFTLAAPGGAAGGGLSYAVPIDVVRGLVNQILSYGRTVRPALGITLAPPQVLERAGVAGVLVLEVPPGSPAAAAGLRPTHRDIFGDLVLGDVITSLDGRPVRTAGELYEALDEHRVGDRVRLELLREGKPGGAAVTLGERVLGSVEE